MKFRIILVLLSGLFVQSIFAQDAFHRTYNTFNDKSLINVSGMQLKDGKYLSLDLLTHKEGSVDLVDSIVITAYKIKGDPLWSTKIALKEDANYLSIQQSNIVQAVNDSIYFTFVTEHPDKANTLVGSISKEGGMGKIKRYGLSEESKDTIGNAFIAAIDSSLYTISDRANFQQDGNILINKTDLKGNLLFSKLYRLDPATFKIGSFTTRMKSTVDKNLLITGLASIEDPRHFITLMDTLGTIKWSRRYLDSKNLKYIPNSFDVEMLSDSSIVSTGISIISNDTTSDLRNSFIMKTDKTGIVEWSKEVRFNTGDENIIKHVTVDKSDNIVIEGVNIDSTTKEVLIFAAKLSKSGEVVWKKKFPRVEGTERYLGGLFTAQDGGSVIFGSSVENEEKVITGMIKLDPNGSSTCEEDIAEDIFFDLSIVADTFQWVSKDTGYVEEVEFDFGAFKHDVQAISLETRNFCPNEPIVWTFKTPISGATFYEWSTGVQGPETDSLTVFDDEKYSVTVTVNERVCYMLCDTAKLNRFTLPSATLIETLGDFCTTGEVRIIAGYQPGHPQIKSIVWSTGESGVNFIDTDQLGNYSVTITDQCDEVATATYNLQFLPTKITQATITQDFSQFCNQNTGILTANGNATGAVAQYTYQWSIGGQTTQSISVVQAGTYTVTVTDFCGTSQVATVTLPESQFPRLTLNSLTSSFADFCVDRGARITVAFTGESSSVRWSTGTNNVNSIVVGSPGTYSVTVSERTCPNIQVTGQINVVFSPENDLISRIELTSFPDLGVNCAQGFVRVSVDYDGFAKSVVWSTGATNTDDINVTDYKEYSVTVTDFCDNSFEAKVQANAPDLTLTYANAFFPETIDTSTMDNNKTFGPIIKGEVCLEAVQDYEFLIFNRWGQLIFTSNRVEDEWNGRFNDETAPAEVYLWRARYTAYGIDKKLGGDVSLLRVLR
ncbi:MAG: gliding motility-associated C-terminal domain-containing protein [Saprospiraceae bacterium]|nr:gliding motility-associated C-terminal domain-containing protein [Saprospiraceae bacterium]